MTVSHDGSGSVVPPRLVLLVWRLFGFLQLISAPLGSPSSLHLLTVTNITRWRWTDLRSVITGTPCS